MNDLTKMMLFMFLGLVVAILVLGFSRSPKASPALGSQRNLTTTSSPPSQSDSQSEPYPSDDRPY